MKTLAAWALSLCLLAFPSYACSVFEALRDENPTRNCPDDIRELAVRVSNCIHLGGEEAYDDARAKQIEDSWAQEKCDDVACDLQDTKTANAQSSEVSGVLIKLEKFWTDAFGAEAASCGKS